MKFSFKNSLNSVQVTYKVFIKVLHLIWGIDKRIFIMTALSTIIRAIIPFINAYIYKLLIDAVIMGINTNAIDTTYLIRLFAYRMIMYFVQRIMFSTHSLIGKIIWTRLPIVIEKKLHEKISSLDMLQLEDSSLHDRLQKAKSSTWRMQQVIDDGARIIESVIQCILGFTVIFYLNWYLIVFIIIVTIPEFIQRIYLSKTSWQIWSWQSPLQRRHGYLAWLLEHIPSVKELRIFALGPTFITEANAIQEQFYKENLSIEKKAYFFQLVFNAFFTVLFIGVEVYIIVLAFMRKLTIGDISFYTQSIISFQDGVSNLLRNTSYVFENCLFVDSYFDMLQVQPVMIHSDTPIVLEANKAPHIVFEHVSFRYPNNEKDTLVDINFEILPGEKIAFVGENGAGKSTIIKLLLRFFDPTSGRILIDGLDLRTIDIHTWHATIGVLFQDFNRYDDTIKNNIYYGNIHKKCSIPEIELAAKNSGADVIVSGF
jgi:ATP-binding cassette subfamily B protein